ncbi:ATP-binding protein [Wenyingzhuangia sp. 1_MG-2023]|nr:ATP-binding protein [Wenyingzhuangia sp. 1_MG-2023]
MEKIFIKNFGGIKEMEFDFKSINILIGSQGTGKSITVKLLYFFKNFINDIVKSVENQESKRDLDKNQKEIFSNYFPKESWGKEDFKIIYTYEHSQIYIERTKNKLTFNYSENIKKVISKCRKVYSIEKAKTSENRKLPSFRIRREINKKIQNCLKEEIGELATLEQFFIPAGRSFFANIQSSIFSFLSDNRSLDPFLIEFGSFYENLKGLYNDLIRDEKSNKDFDNLVSEILNSSYFREKEKDFLIHKDSRKVNLTNASSGQQETLPLMVILKTLNNLNSTGGGFTLYIEEPEAHLFPTAQKKIVQLLARTFNNNPSINFQIFVTTHSPYILSSFNNLMYAGNLSESEENAEKIKAIIPKEELLPTKLMSVYSINNKNNTFLIDKEDNLISQTILDSVSEVISLEFDKLLDVEFNEL